MAQLGVVGSVVTNRNCGLDGNGNQLCTFDASNDGTVYCRVIGGAGSASYHLHPDIL